MTDARCTNPDCDHPAPDGFLCWPCTNLLHALLSGIAFTTRRRGIGPVLEGHERDAIREGIDGSNYRLDTLREPPTAGPGLLEDLDVTIARIDAIPYRPNPAEGTCREPDCGRPADYDGRCSECADYLPASAKRVALVPPAARARERLIGALTSWALVLSEESGVEQVRAALVTAEDQRGSISAPWSPTVLDERIATITGRLQRLTPPPIPHLIGWLAGSIKAIRLREWAGDMLADIESIVEDAQHTVDRPEQVLRIDCPRCGRKIPVVPKVVTGCRSCRADGTEEGWRMFGDAHWWASQVAPEGEWIRLSEVELAMLQWGLRVTYAQAERWMKPDGPLARWRVCTDAKGRLLVPPQAVAEEAMRVQSRRRTGVRAVTR